jgi:hypothetical protein
MLAGVIPPTDLLAIKMQLCKPFLGVPTDLVPTSGWSWAQLQNVPTVNQHGLVWMPEDLYASLIANPCFVDTLICVPPHWQGNPAMSGKAYSTVFVAYIDDSMTITQHATLKGISMFGAQVKFIHCSDSLTLVQCGRCHMLDHHATSAKCRLPKDMIKCYRCRGQHDGCDHDYKCPKRHRVPGKCDCRLKCMLCRDMGHHCHSPKCPKHSNITVPHLVMPEDADKHPEPGRQHHPSLEPKSCQHQQGKPHAGTKAPRVPCTNHEAAMMVPAGACANNPEKSNISCMCCPLPSIVQFTTHYMSAELEPDSVTPYYPRARPISSKGKGLLNIYRELIAQKKYGTALLKRAPELNITLHNEEEIEALLAEGEHAAHTDFDYGHKSNRTWGLDEVGPSTGWDTDKDTAPTNKPIGIYPDCNASLSVGPTWTI